ncbi:MAG: 3-mercaptopyruvate sulfurtransferase [Gammaproteobacteria bacterium]|nr:3-mercaptopyruvate sulfurtransferase [Gammaproteobacteria bacterium]
MSMLQLPGSLVDVEWLHQHLDDPQLIIFDASWHMPGTQRDAHEEWRDEHIKGAQFFDFDQTICAADTALPHMMPDAETFTTEVQKLGLNEDSVVVVYDSLCMFTAPRVWGMLRAMGFDNCAILDGGLPAWHRAGYDVDRAEEAAASQSGNFVAKPVDGLFCGVEEVSEALQGDTVAVVDARPSPRYRGDVDEPRPGLRRGHMPGASNLPFPDMFENGIMKSKGQLKALLADHFNSDQHSICSCGSGVTACVITFAAHLLGNDNTSVYDGSWSEWGLPGNLPVVTE